MGFKEISGTVISAGLVAARSVGYTSMVLENAKHWCYRKRTGAGTNTLTQQRWREKTAAPNIQQAQTPFWI